LLISFISLRSFFKARATRPPPEVNSYADSF
jgi:hypothetical protein